MTPQQRALTAFLVALAFGLLTQPLEAAEDKVTICHVPPGNPNARHTIRVGASAVPAHLAHGDSIGQCPTSCQLNASLCDDGNLCTDDFCLPDGQCSHRVVNCDDGNVCTQDLCVETVGCTYLPVSQTTQCDDSNTCTAQDTCVNGVCKGTAIAGCCTSGADCSDGNACTSDVCSGNVCSNPAVICRSDNKCVAAFCDPGTGGCSTAPVNCDDSNVCTDDSCDPVVGCRSVPTQHPPEPIETSCADGVDNDCDGLVDANDPNCACPAGQTLCGGVCTVVSQEVCDGIDNDCNGLVDDNVGQTCYPFDSGTPGLGICSAGVQQCTAAACGIAPNPCCPIGWPAGKPCPGTASFGACVGAVGPVPEVCDRVDNNCNGVVDDVSGGVCP